MEKNKKWGIFFTCIVASEAEQTGLSLTWSETTKDRLSHDMAHLTLMFPDIDQVNVGVLWSCMVPETGEWRESYGPVM